MRFVITLAILSSLTGLLSAQDRVEQRLSSIERRLDTVESEVRRAASEASNAAPYGFVAFLSGVFCALWAQNTGRSAWIWFFLGLFFNIITLIVLLSKNSSNRKMTRPKGAAGNG